MKIVETALDAALAEICRQGGPDYLLAEARAEGLAAAKIHEEALVDRICFLIGQAHDTSALWEHMRRDPDAFRVAVRFALGEKQHEEGSEVRPDGFLAVSKLERTLSRRFAFSETGRHIVARPAEGGESRTEGESAIGERARTRVHVLSQDGQPYGSERRSCNYCGIMIWGPVVPPHVETWTEWRTLPNNCSK